MNQKIQEALKGLINFNLNPFGLKNCRNGKVRSLGEIGDDYLLAVTNYRWSAFNYNSTQPMPYRAEALNAQNRYIFEEMGHVAENWTIENPFPTVTVGRKLQMIPYEFVFRRIFMGSLYKDYMQGSRGEHYGLTLDEGLTEFFDFGDTPLFTPTRKSKDDEPISQEQMLAENEGYNQDLVQEAIWKGYELFSEITSLMQEKNLLLADCKFEFGVLDGEVIWADEAPNADSARYFNLVGFYSDLDRGKRPKQFSKEYFRELLRNKYDWTGQTPNMPRLEEDELENGGIIYKDLTKMITGKELPYVNYETAYNDICDVVADCVRKYK